MGDRDSGEEREREWGIVGKKGGDSEASYSSL